MEVLERGQPGQPRRRLAWRGIYALPRRKFVASCLMPRDRALEDASDKLMLELDIAALRTAVEAVNRTPVGVLFVSFSFTAVVRPSARAALKPYLDNLPPELRHRLGVTVRDTPREPSFSALSHINETVRPHFGLLDIQITDPGFRIDSFPATGATSVTLKLEGVDDRARLTVIKRFLDQRPAYVRRKVVQGLSNLRRPKELELCQQLRAPFVTGPAVSGLLDSPLCDRPWPIEELPYHVDFAATG